MAHTRASVIIKARTSTSGNPATSSIVIAAGTTVLCLMIKGVGSSARTGGSPSMSGGDPVNGTATFTQAGTTQKAASSPEASAELWYFLNPLPGTYTLTVPNTAAIALFYTVEGGAAAAGGRSELDGTNGGNATSTDPTPGAVTVTTAGDIAWAITAGGWTTWSPSAQVGTAIANTDDGADGGGEQYIISPAIGSHTLSWTFGTSDDWGAVSAYFKETVPQALNNYMRIGASGLSVTEGTR